MKKIIGIVLIILVIPIVIFAIGEVDKIPIYPTTEFTLTKDNQISILDLPTQNELYKLPNNVSDKWFSDGTIERNVKKVILNGNEDWEKSSSQGYYRLMIELDIEIKDGIRNDIISNLYTSDSALNIIVNDIDKTITLYNSDVISLVGSSFIQYIFVRDDTYPTLELFKQHLNSNNLIIYYQVINPSIETSVELPTNINYYTDGNVVLDDGIVDYTVDENIAYINYLEGNITEVINEQFVVSKPSKIISKRNDIIDYDINTLPPYFEYGTVENNTYNNLIEFINKNDNKEIKLYIDGVLNQYKYTIVGGVNEIILKNIDGELLTIFSDDTYNSLNNIDDEVVYKLVGDNIIDYQDGRFDNNTIAFFWIIPVLLAGGLIYLLLKRKE